MVSTALEPSIGSAEALSDLHYGPTFLSAQIIFLSLSFISVDA